ncbi:hypothetical protein X759_28215 [Mesorhizobium sp. LSHC420B00]|nr:hypothetical protein X759_28215 [Mesorhizobium sp. LSHC420B00]
MVFALALAATPVSAQQKLSLEVTVPAATLPSSLFSPNGGAADFLGVGLGQTLDDIRKILTGQNFTNEDSSGRFLLDEEYFTVEIIATGPNRYFTHVIWSGPEDAEATQSVRVEFSSPLTGQRSTDVRRLVTYNGGKGPLLATLRAAILQKFGPPSVDGNSSMRWFWSKGQQVKKSAAHDKQMAIGMDVRSDYVTAITYELVDDAAAAADRDQVTQFQKSVEGAAKKIRDGNAAAPKL